MTNFANEPAETKQCRSCGLTKNIGDFHKDSSSSDGHRSTCKICFNESRRTNRTNRTREIDDQQSSDFSPVTSGNITPSYKSYSPGTELTLVLPKDEGSNLMMEKTNLCPGCCKYNVLWLRHLVAPGVLIPIGVCNDCLLQVSNELVSFYESDGILYIVRATQTAHLSNLM